MEKTKIKKIALGCLAVATISAGGFYYRVSLPTKITPKAAQIKIAEQPVYMLGEEYLIKAEILSDVDLGLVDMPETKTILGMTFPAKYDISEFIPDVTYSVSDDTLLTINEEGLISPTNTGTGNLSITCDEIAETVDVTVKTYVLPKELPESAEILIDQSDTLIDEIGDFEILNTEFISSDENIVKVNELGVVTGINKGTADISCKLEDGSQGVTSIRVYQPVYEIKASDKSIYVGNTVKVNAQLLPEGCDYATELTYSSSDETVATVNSNGVITGKKAGTATITVKSANEVTAELKVAVSNKPVVQAPVSSSPSTPAVTPSSGDAPGGSNDNAPIQLRISEAEMDSIIAQANSALGSHYDGSVNQYSASDNVTTAGKSYDQVYSEVMGKVGFITGVDGMYGRVFRIGNTIIVARDLAW